MNCETVKSVARFLGRFCFGWKGVEVLKLDGLREPEKIKGNSSQHVEVSSMWSAAHQLVIESDRDCELHSSRGSS